MKRDQKNMWRLFGLNSLRVGSLLSSKCFQISKTTLKISPIVMKTPELGIYNL